MSKKKSKKSTIRKKKAVKKPVREKAYGDYNKVVPLQDYIKKHEVSKENTTDTIWSKLLKKLGLYKK